MSFLGAAASAQQSLSTTQTIPKPPALRPAVLGAPFSAERHQVRNRTLDDGTRIAETWPVHKIFRDAQGRMRTERPLLTFPDAPALPVIIQLDDPAAGTQTILDSQKKLAHRFTSIQIAMPPPESATAEDLGAWVIQGLRAEGTRRTLGPIVTETWTAPDLHLFVRQKLTDPRFGESVNELTRIHMGDQDASLFEIPAGFRIVDEPRDFAIPYTVHSNATLPVIVTKVPAVYTESARKSGVQGVVHLTLFVDETGQAQGIHVEHSLEPGLDQEAIKAVRRWRFRPGERDGHAVKVPVRVEVTFSLNN
jgi:TonB family protein